MNLYKKIKKSYFYFIVIYALPHTVLSAPGVVGVEGSGGTSAGGGKLPNPIGYSTFMEFVKAILEVVLKIGIPVAAIFIIYSGLLFVKAQGNETELEKAKKAFTYAVIGTAILLASWILAVGIESTINTLKA